MANAPLPTPAEDSVTTSDQSWPVEDHHAKELAQRLLPVMFVVQKRLTRCPDDFASSHGPPTVSQVRAVLYLFDHESVPVGELAEALELSRSAATELIDRLVERGMVTRAPNAEDRRQVMVTLTPKAREKSRHVQTVRLERLIRVISSLEPDERQGFVHGMMRLADELLPMKTATYAENGTLSTIPDSTAPEDLTHD